MTKIKPVRVGNPDIQQEIVFALKCIAIGAVIFMIWEICQGKV